MGSKRSQTAKNLMRTRRPTPSSGTCRRLTSVLQCCGNYPTVRSRTPRLSDYSPHAHALVQATLPRLPEVALSYHTESFHNRTLFTLLNEKTKNKKNTPYTRMDPKIQVSKPRRNAYFL